MARTLREKNNEEALQDAAYSDGAETTGWAVTLSDLMMLLVTFFVMMYSLSEPDAESYAQALKQIGDALGGKSIVEKRSEPLEEAQQKLAQIITDNNLVNDVELTSDTRGLVLFSRGDFFFKSGQVQVMKETKIFLKMVAKIIRVMPYTVMVEGHTDDVPMSGKGAYPTNWELSTARAASVVRYFVEEQRLDPKRFIVAGYAEYKPRFPVRPENRPKNRRVEIIILKKKL